MSEKDVARRHENGPNAWKQGYDESCSSGLSSKTCGALVAHNTEMANLHTAWDNQHG